ncbi:septal ring lytic transglycosylase RlpA family protein [bacterium]|nr:septal ring lytic transglycosylase RlpA family protein [bacterium]
MRKRSLGALFLAVSLFFCSCIAAPRYIARRPVRGHPGEFEFNEQVGIASYYADQFHGRPTSSGQIFDMNALTAAHRTLPLGTIVIVTLLETGKSVEVLVNDRGPFAKARVLDLSKAAAEKIGLFDRGTGLVSIRIIDSIDRD